MIPVLVFASGIIVGIMLCALSIFYRHVAKAIGGSVRERFTNKEAQIVPEDKTWL